MKQISFIFAIVCCLTLVLFMPGNVVAISYSNNVLGKYYWLLKGNGLVNSNSGRIRITISRGGIEALKPPGSKANALHENPKGQGYHGVSTQLNEKIRGLGFVSITNKLKGGWGKKAEFFVWELSRPMTDIDKYEEEILPLLEYVDNNSNFEEVYEAVMNPDATPLSAPPTPIYEAVSPGETASPSSTPPLNPEYGELDHSPLPWSAPPTPNAGYDSDGAEFDPNDPGEGASPGIKRRRCN